MKNVIAIYTKELRAYFNSMSAYLFMVIFLGLSGYMFFSQFFKAGQASMRMFFSLTPFLFVLFAPSITMRLISEEKRSGTIELMLTMPLSDLQLLLGKFFAALTVLMAGVVLTLVYPITLSGVADFDWGPIAGGYIGLLFLGGGYIALGMLASSLTGNQINGLIIGLALCAVFFLLDKVLMFAPPVLTPILEYLAVDFHFKNIARGVIDSRDVIYFLSLISACFMLSLGVLSRREGI